MEYSIEGVPWFVMWRAQFDKIELSLCLNYLNLEMIENRLQFVASHAVSWFLCGLRWWLVGL